MAKKLTDKEMGDNLDFFGRNNVPEDPNFSAKRNNYIIDKTIKQNDAMVAERNKQFKKSLGERVDAVGYYLRSQHGAQSGVPIDKYLGKRWQARLRGEQIVRKLKNPINLRDF